jgi:hypothetical protein
MQGNFEETFENLFVEIEVKYGEIEKLNVKFKQMHYKQTDKESNVR